MKILILNDATSGGGAEAYVDMLASKLSDESHIDVIKVARLGTQSTSLTPENNERMRLSSYGGIRNFNYFLNKVVKRENPDILHVNIVQQVYMNTIVSIARKRRIKLVVTVHDYAPLCPTLWFVKNYEMTPCEKPYPNKDCMKCIISANRFGERGSIKSTMMYHVAKSIWTMQLWSRFLNSSDIVITPSIQLANQLRRIVKGPKLYQLWNPVPDELLNTPVTPIINDCGKVVFIGRLVLEKGVGIIPRIAAELSKSGFLVQVVGTGPLSDYLQRASGQAKNLIYSGYVTNEEKVKIIEESSAVLVPSIWCEPFGIVVTEALARGRPVVAFNIGGPKETIEASQGGVLAKPFEIGEYSEKTRALVSDIEKSNMLGRNGRRWVDNNLGLNRYVREYLKIVTS